MPCGEIVALGMIEVFGDPEKPERAQFTPDVAPVLALPEPAADTASDDEDESADVPPTNDEVEQGSAARGRGGRRGNHGA